MSVDQTIAELSGTLAQLSILVEHINGQIGGVTGRINMTLDNFDQSVAGIAGDASALTNQVGITVRQVPNSWVFYFLLITLIVVLILLGVLIIIHLATKIHAIYRICFTDTTNDSGLNTPISRYSETRLLQYENSLQRPAKSDRVHISLPIEPEPRRPLQTAFESGINPTFREGYPSVRTISNNNEGKLRQLHGTPALETMCTSFVHYGSPVKLAMPPNAADTVQRVASPLVVEPSVLGQLDQSDVKTVNRTESSDRSFRRSSRRLPTVECNSAGNVIVGRAASANAIESNTDDWVPINIGNETSPPPSAPSYSPIGQKVVLATDSFQNPPHQPYVRRPQPVGAMSHASTPNQDVPQAQPRYMMSKTEPV
uniref:Plasma membrane fusion protein PRM1 n=1 Tax=Panagrellus redivivus TaxID=6233 RepID=A0A7E4W3K1_PANRE